MDTQQANQTAATILKQLGGNKFVCMTGAKNMAFDDTGALSFKIGRNSAGINYVKISLNSLDLYDVEYRMITVKQNTSKSKSNNIYSNMLRGDFERVTGLRTSLTHVYA